MSDMKDKAAEASKLQSMRKENDAFLDAFNDLWNRFPDEKFSVLLAEIVNRSNVLQILPDRHGENIMLRKATMDLNKELE